MSGINISKVTLLPQLATFFNISLNDVIIEYAIRHAGTRTTLESRLFARVCELCGKTDIPLAMHHVNKVKNLKGKQRWRAVYIERCTYGFGMGLGKPIAVMRKGRSFLLYETLLFSERAFAYKMKCNAIKRQSGRPPKEKGSRIGNHFDGRKTYEIVGDESGKKLKKYFPELTTPQRMEEIIIKLLENWLKHKNVKPHNE